MLFIVCKLGTTKQCQHSPSTDADEHRIAMGLFQFPEILVVISLIFPHFWNKAPVCINVQWLHDPSELSYNNLGKSIELSASCSLASIESFGIKSETDI